MCRWWGSTGENSQGVLVVVEVSVPEISTVVHGCSSGTERYVVTYGGILEEVEEREIVGTGHVLWEVEDSVCLPLMLSL